MDRISGPKIGVSGRGKFSVNSPTADDPRFLEGIRLFNAREFFEAHEVWEDLWHEMTDGNRRFVQSLIQVAVCVYHASNGNALGARRLFASAKRYMLAYGQTHWGVDIPMFWNEMTEAMSEFHQEPLSLSPKLFSERLPTIGLRSVD